MTASILTKTLAHLRTPKLLLYTTQRALLRLGGGPETESDLTGYQRLSGSLRSFLGKYLPGG